MRAARAIIAISIIAVGVGACSDDEGPEAAIEPTVVLDDTMPDRVVPPTVLTTTTTTTTTTVAPTTTTAPLPTAPTTSAPAPPAPPPPPAQAPAARPKPAPTPAPPMAMAAPAPAPAPAGDAESRALQLVNQERSAAGLPALQMNGGARSVARGWSATMSSSGMAHNPDLSGDLARAGVTGWRAVAENVGYGSSVDQVHHAFMASSGHRSNILHPTVTQVGIGVVQSGGTVWVTMVFVGF